MIRFLIIFWGAISCFGILRFSLYNIPLIIVLSMVNLFVSGYMAACYDYNRGIYGKYTKSKRKG